VPDTLTQEDGKRNTGRREVGAACEEWVRLGLAFSVHLLHVPLEEQMSGTSQDYVLPQLTQSHCKCVVWSPSLFFHAVSGRRDLLTEVLLPGVSFWHPKGMGAADGELPLCLMLSFSPHEVVFCHLRTSLDLQTLRQFWVLSCGCQ